MIGKAVAEALQGDGCAVDWVHDVYDVSCRCSSSPPPDAVADRIAGPDSGADD